jgi:hypothetical protein
MMTRRMTKAERADVLLEGAMHFQNNGYAGPSFGPELFGPAIGESALMAMIINEGPITTVFEWCSIMASLALSEVGALGFDIEEE